MRLWRLLATVLIALPGTLAVATQDPEYTGDQSCALTADNQAQLRQSLEVTRVMRMDRPLPGVISPNGAYQYWLTAPGRHQPSPFEYLVDIDSEGDDLQRIRLPGVSEVVAARWVTEKLIYIQWMWPGDIAAELLHDVESGDVVSLKLFCVQ